MGVCCSTLSVSADSHERLRIMTLAQPLGDGAEPRPQPGAVEDAVALGKLATDAVLVAFPLNLHRLARQVLPLNPDMNGL